MQYHWPKTVVYSIFVPSFADSNGDGIGDINGIRKKLDYLTHLGIGAIWLSPVHPSPSYHKYDVVDYLAVDIDFGSLFDFRQLVKEAHARGIQVIMDFVINHTSVDHPWFRQARSSVSNPYREYYVWRKYEDVKDKIKKDEITQDSDNIYQWHENDVLGDYYYGFFWEGMADLNMDHPPLRDEIVKIADFWLNDVGVDGFRLDAAKHLYPENEYDRAVAFWEYFEQEMRALKSDVILIGEVWDEIDVVSKFLKGLPAVFNFDLSIGLPTAIQNGNKELVKLLVTTKDQYSKVRKDYVDAIFLTNHDQNRIASELENDGDKIKLAASILLTLPGTPFIYYGEELGMLGMKPDPHIREPFLWEKKSTDGMRCAWIEAQYSLDRTVAPYRVQLEDPQSVFMHYRELLRFRNQYRDVFGHSAFEVIDVDNESVMAYEIGGQISVWHNLSQETLAVVDLKTDVEVAWQKGGRLEKNRKLMIHPLGSIVLKYKDTNMESTYGRW